MDVQLPDLPVRSVLGELDEALAGPGCAVLVAPPGTGKTTVVPLHLAMNAAPDSGRIVVAEPRRLAARAAAARMADLLGEAVGQTVGYSIRGERKVSAATRIEVVTSGLLVRRVQGDPELPGVATVLLDECHERHLDADLLLALLLDVRAGLREDLRLLAASATVAAGPLAALLGSAPLITAHARTHPIDIVHTAAARREGVERHVARTIRSALSETEGDVLAFLPGTGEISRVHGMLSGLSDVDVLPLHGRLPADKQDAALRAGPRRRIVLSTAVAESSLTVPGVRVVVDSGKARVPRVDHRRGLPGLATVRVAAAVADQRAGRAGREAPGVAYRCWPRNEHAALPAFSEPEIRTAELSRLALELACWSTPDGRGLSWWDPPPAGPLAAGQELLRLLGAVGAGGEITERGHAMAALGLHPRLARALLDGAASTGARHAAEVVALLDSGATRTDVDAELRRLREAKDPAARRWRSDVRRLTGLVIDDGRGKPDPALVVALAHPERLARRRSPGSSVYLLAGGTAAELPPGSGLGDSEWLAVAEATRDPGRAHGVIRLAARADAELAVRAGHDLLSDVEEVGWSGGDVVARSVRSLGAITLTERPLRAPEPGLVRSALTAGLRIDGLGLLHWSTDATRLRDRLAFLHDHLGAPWPPMDDSALLAAADSWLEPELSRAARRVDLGRIEAGHALRRLLPWPAAARLDDLAPDRIEVPGGSRIKVDYSGEDPVLAVRLQQTFGWRATPRIADGRVAVVLHLLSPAGRPAAITADLESFWRTGYPQVRADLRGRYPKHSWPEDPQGVEAKPRRRP